MNLRISGLIAAFALAGLLGRTQSRAQNAYITNSSSDNVSVIDTEKNKVTATIVGSFVSPYGVAVSPNGRKVYITNSLTSVGNSNVSVIDTEKNKVIATIPVGSEPGGVAVSPDGSKAFVANANSATVSVDRHGNQYGDRHDPCRSRSLRPGGDPGRQQGLCYD